MNPDTIKILADLPWNLQIVLGSGYCAYRLSYFGLRHNHKAIDEIFIAISFGLIAAAALHLTPIFLHSASSWHILAPWLTPISAASAFLITTFVGLFWRVIGRESLRWAFRQSYYSWNDETDSAWEHLLECQNRPTQITVETDDGWSLYCTDASRTNDLPFGPYVLGASGDLLMYVDQSEAPESSPREDDPREVPGVFDDQWGNLVTYLPKERVRSIRIRYAPVTSRVGVVERLKALGLKLVAAMRRHHGKVTEQE